MSTSARPLALVTGARRGIGAGIAIELASRGFDVGVDRHRTPRRRRTLAAIEAQGARGTLFAIDLADIDRSCRAGRTRSSPGAGRLPASSTTPASRRRSAATCSTSAPSRTTACSTSTCAAPSSSRRRWPGTWWRATSVHQRSIVTVSSVSVEMASIERGEYCLSKAGLGMLTKLFALRLAPLGIGVFEVRPGVIRTPMTEGVADKYEQPHRRRPGADGALGLPGGRGARRRRTGAAASSPSRPAASSTSTARFRSRVCEHGNLRLHHHRRRLGGLRARESTERRSGRQGAAARSRRLRLAPVLPHARGLREDDQGHRLVGLANGAAEAPEEPRAALHAGQGDRGRLVDQRSAVHARRAGRLRRMGQRGGRDRLVAIATCCRTSSARRTTSASPTSSTPTAGRSACPTRSAHCRSARPSSRRGRSSAFRSTPTSTARAQEGLGYYQLTQLDARRSSASIGFLNPVRSRPNLTVMLQSQALRVIVEGRPRGRRRDRQRRRPHTEHGARRAARSSCRRARSARRSC